MQESVIYQAVVSESEERGRTKGRAEGRAEEAQRLIIALGTRRFGPPSGSVESQIGQISDPERLERMVLRVLDAGSWDDLLNMP